MKQKNVYMLDKDDGKAVDLFFRLEMSKILRKHCYAFHNLMNANLLMLKKERLCDNLK